MTKIAEILSQKYTSKHKVLYRPDQVELSIGCYGIKLKPGLRLGLLDNNLGSFYRENIPQRPIFHPGKITSITGPDYDPTIEFRYDANPFATALVANAKSLTKFLIPLGNPAGGEDLECQSCKKDINPTFEFCPHCGSKQ